MHPEKVNKIYFLGIGGIGMSALARYYHRKGILVSGYDKTPSALTNQLMAEGIQVHFQDSLSQIPEALDLVIYTPAVPYDLNIFVHLKNSGIPMRKRSEILGMITRNYKTIAVAGTHGKTTVSTLTAHLLQNSGIDCTAILGGISKNTGTNLMVSEKSDWLVVEADEYDRSFLQIKPSIATVTSMDADHLDIYNDYRNLKTGFLGFLSKTRPNGKIILKKGIDLKPVFDGIVYSYALKDKADFYSENIKLKDDQYIFDLITPFGKIKDCSPGMPGILNVENTIAASANALLAGVNAKEIKMALPGFQGIRRRFDYQIRAKDLIFIDDYAHHPEEIKAFVNSVRKIYPGKSITGIFQPHLYSRTRDFADGFAAALSLLDRIILLPVYPAREEPIEGVDSAMILSRIKIEKKILVEKTRIFDTLDQHHYDILLTIGAGDIDLLIEPLKKHLQTKHCTT
ncbi:MAG: UDP-N-acetylmuramate--L-alanine ligase [Bacteroidales bacterium]